MPQISRPSAHADRKGNRFERWRRISDRTFYVCDCEVAFKQAENAIRSENAAHALDRLHLKLHCHIDQFSGRAVSKCAQFLEDALRQTEKSGEIGSGA